MHLAVATAIIRRGLADHVYEQIKMQLFESRFGREGWLSVETLATELQVSRQPVLESLKRLSFEGFVTIIPQVGCRVREYTNEEIHDFYRMFAFAEGFVAELAAARATADDIATLRAISDRIGRLATARSTKQMQAQAYRVLNRELHKEIRRIARSSSVTELVEGMGDRSDFFIATSGRPMLAESLRQAHDEHQGVIEAIAKHNAAAASEMMKLHIIETNSRLQGFLREKELPAASRKASRAGS